MSRSNDGNGKYPWHPEHALCRKLWQSERNASYTGVHATTWPLTCRTDRNGRHREGERCHMDSFRQGQRFTRTYGWPVPTTVIGRDRCSHKHTGCSAFRRCLPPSWESPNHEQKRHPVPGVPRIAFSVGSFDRVGLRLSRQRLRKEWGVPLFAALPSCFQAPISSAWPKRCHSRGTV